MKRPPAPRQPVISKYEKNLQQAFGLLLIAITGLLLFRYAWPSSRLAQRVILSLQTIGAVFTFLRLGKYVRSTSIRVPRRGDSPSTDTPSSSRATPTLQRGLSVFDKVHLAEVNPFENKTWKIGQWERLRLSLFAVTVAPVRFAALLASLVAGFVVAKVALVGVSRPLERPLPRVNRLLLQPLRWVARAILFSCGFHWIPSKGARVGHSVAPMVVGNHICFMEPVYMVYAFLPSPVGAGEHLKIPLVSTMIRALQTVTVDRKDPDSRRKVVQSMKDRSVTPGWPQILLFPEGTTTNGRSCVTFKKGAFIPGQPVQPVAFRYQNERFDPSWVVAGPSAGNILLRMLCEPANLMTVQFLPPYEPNEAERADADLFGRNVRAVICDALTIPGTEHAYEDVLLQQKAVAAGLPPDTGIVEFMSLKKHFVSLDLKDVKSQLERFRDLDTDGDGLLDRDEFLRAFDSKDEHSPEVDHLFDLLDVNQTGFIDFRHFLVGLGMINDLNPDDIISLAFKMFDVDSTNRISVKQLQRVVSRIFADLDELEVQGLLRGVVEGQDADGMLDFEQFQQFARTDPRYVETFRTYFS